MPKQHCRSTESVDKLRIGNTVKTRLCVVCFSFVFECVFDWCQNDAGQDKLHKHVQTLIKFNAQGYKSLHGEYISLLVSGVVTVCCIGLLVKSCFTFRLAE